MMKVMVFGTFDRLHPGHFSYLRQAKKYGQKLVLILARDSNVKKIKNHFPKENEIIRKRNLENFLKKENIKSLVVLGDLKNKWLVLEKYQPDIIALGYDQQVDLLRLKKELNKLNKSCQIRRLKAYHSEKYKSSLL